MSQWFYRVRIFGDDRLNGRWVPCAFVFGGLVALVVHSRDAATQFSEERLWHGSLHEVDTDADHLYVAFDVPSRGVDAVEGTVVVQSIWIVFVVRMLHLDPAECAFPVLIGP